MLSTNKKLRILVNKTYRKLLNVIALWLKKARLTHVDEQADSHSRLKFGVCIVSIDEVF
jgi:hypothetical protein